MDAKLSSESVLVLLLDHQVGLLMSSKVEIGSGTLCLFDNRIPRDRRKAAICSRCTCWRFSSVQSSLQRTSATTGASSVASSSRGRFFFLLRRAEDERMLNNSSMVGQLQRGNENIMRTKINGFAQRLSVLRPSLPEME
jgi:hypothetical protein